MILTSRSGESFVFALAAFTMRNDTMKIVTPKRGKLMAGSDPLSVLVVDEEPAILTFIARVLDANGMRALLARGTEEAIAIAHRSYVPIDLILTDVVVRNAVEDAVSESAGAELVSRLREIRPGTRALYMSAFVDSGVVRIQLMNRQGQAGTEQPTPPDLIASIRGEATASLAFGSGTSPVQ
jgi:CheY-like chemotaxis protein